MESVTSSNLSDFSLWWLGAVGSPAACRGQRPAAYPCCLWRPLELLAIAQPHCFRQYMDPQIPILSWIFLVEVMDKSQLP